MTRAEIIEALIPADLAVRSGKPLALPERIAAVEALKAVRGLSGPERVAIHDAVRAGADLRAA